MDTARVDVVPGQDEQFQSLMEHLQRQTAAAERTARHVGTIEMLLTLALVLAAVAGLIALVVGLHG